MDHPKKRTFIKRLFSSSLLSAIRVVSSALNLGLIRYSPFELRFLEYLKLLMFLPAILIPACALSSPAFCMMYSAYKLNKKGEITIYNLNILLYQFRSEERRVGKECR